MTIAALLIVAGIGLYVIISPILQYRRQPWRFDTPSGEEESLRQERLIALDALRDLARDYRMGQLSKEDYRAMAVPLQQRAKSTLVGQTASVEKETDLERLDAQLEAEILAVRQQMSTNGAARYCSQCGQQVGQNFRFCASCGNPLAELHDKADPVEADSSKSTSQDRRLEQPTTTEKRPADDMLTNVLPAASRTRRWWVWAAGFTVFWIFAVVWIFLAGRARQEAQVPVVTLSDGPVQSLAAANSTLLAASTSGISQWDNGSGWTDATDVHQFVSMAALDTSGNSWIGTDGQQLWRSEDSGQTWTRFNSESADLPISVIANIPGSEVSLYGATAQVLYFSHDAGATWQIVTSSPPGQIRTIAAGQNDLYLGTDKGVFLSRDRGISWVDFNGMVNGRIGTTDVRALALDDAGGIIFAGTPLGLYFMNLSSPGGWGQRSLRANVTALAVERAKGNELWVGTASGEVFRSTDRGVTWQSN